MEPLEPAEVAAADQAAMRKYFTDPNLFVMEAEKLHERIRQLRRRYDAEAALLKPPLQDLLRDRTNEFRVENLAELLPRFLIRISCVSQRFLSLGLNFLRSATDAITDHVQTKVAHFHEALLVLGGLLDEHLGRFEARFQGLHARVKGIERLLGLTATTATAMAGPSDSHATTIAQRLTALEALCQDLKGELLILKLTKMRASARDDAANSRATSPAARSTTSVESAASRATSRASTLLEARQHLDAARRTGSTHDSSRKIFGLGLGGSGALVLGCAALRGGWVGWKLSLLALSRAL